MLIRMTCKFCQWSHILSFFTFPFSHTRLQNTLFTCRLGWKHPWGVRVRLAELLLAVVQRGYSEGPSEEAAELEGTLASRLWPPLCINPAVHDSLTPFLNFREYCRSGEHALRPFPTRISCIYRTNLLLESARRCR